MTSRMPFMLLVLALVVAGLSNIYYRHVEVGVPLTAGEQIDVWQIEAEIEFFGRNEPVTARLTLPRDSKFELVDEFTASPAYGVHLSRDGEKSEVTWSKRQVQGKQTLYYQASFRQAINPVEEQGPAGEITADTLAEPYQSSAQTILDGAYARSGDQEFLILELLKLFASADQNVSMLLSRYSKSEALVQLVQMAGIAAQPVRGLILEDGRRNQQLIPLVKIYIDRSWQLIDVESGQLKPELPVLIWQQGSPSLLDVEGGRRSSIRFAISHNKQSALQEANRSAMEGDILDFGLYHLPVAEQNLFKGILLLPIGALVVVFLRLIIGLKCSGTFMPILIATSFIQTELVNGVIGFLAIVSIGLLIRSYLSHLNLLLVSRISAVVIVVIAIIVLFTVIAFRMGLTEALTITFFPMIIMAWTIERMSILWEEEGAKEVLIQGSGSLIVAVIAY
ncbi:MAG: UUP1 family membrane protein, partial [Pseudomonadota bacterium]